VPQRKGFGSLQIEQSFAGCGETCFYFAADDAEVQSASCYLYLGLHRMSSVLPLAVWM
jgi:hypothetical protein